MNKSLAYWDSRTTQDDRNEFRIATGLHKIVVGIDLTGIDVK